MMTLCFISLIMNPTLQEVVYKCDIPNITKWLFNTSLTLCQILMKNRWDLLLHVGSHMRPNLYTSKKLLIYLSNANSFLIYRKVRSMGKGRVEKNDDVVGKDLREGPISGILARTKQEHNTPIMPLNNSFKSRQRHTKTLVTKTASQKVARRKKKNCKFFDI